MTRVLLIMTARIVGGAEKYALQLVRALDGRAQFTVLLADHPNLQPLAAQLGQTARVIPVPFDKPRSLLRIAALTRRLAAQHDIVAINSNHPGSRLGIAMVLALKGDTTPIVCIEHRVSALDDIIVPALLKPILPAMFRYSRRHVAKLIAVSHQNAQVLHDLYRIPSEKITVIHNGAPVPLMDDQAAAHARRAKRAELGFSDADRLILTVARLATNKGIGFLIKAMPEVLAAHPKAHVLLAGTGEDRDRLEQLAESLGLRAHIHFLGFREDVPELLAASDVFVLPSLDEGLPVALLEAMSMGLIPICSAVGGMPEVVEDGISGFLVPPADVVALAEAIRRVFALNEGERERVREAVLQRAALFSVQHMADRTLRLFQSLVAGDKRNGQG